MTHSKRIKPIDNDSHWSLNRRWRHLARKLHSVGPHCRILASSRASADCLLRPPSSCRAPGLGHLLLQVPWTVPKSSSVSNLLRPQHLLSSPSPAWEVVQVSQPSKESLDAVKYDPNETRFFFRSRQLLSNAGLAGRSEGRQSSAGSSDGAQVSTQSRIQCPELLQRTSPRAHRSHIARPHSADIPRRSGLLSTQIHLREL